MNMFAIIEIGGKQFKITAGDIIRIPSLGVHVHQLIMVKKILLLGTENHTLVGCPTLAGVQISAQVMGHDRMAKVMVFKKKRRKHYMKLNTHRQRTTTLKILSVSF